MSASLATILTGQHAWEHGIRNNFTPETLDPSGTLINLLHDSGYATFAGGKFWELGDGSPTDFGIDVSEYLEDENHLFVRQSQQQFLDFVATAPRPWFAWYAPRMPHRPWEETPGVYLDLIDPNAIVVPDWIAPSSEFNFRQRQTEFLATMAWLDDELGNVLDVLDQTGQTNDTLIVTYNDNGLTLGYVSKQSPYERGSLTHVSFTQPGQIPVQQIGPGLVATVDIPATILDFAGVAQPAAFSGVSLRNALAAGSGPRTEVFGANYSIEPLPGDDQPPYETPLAIYVRTERWKYIRFLADVLAEYDGAEVKWKHWFLPFPTRFAGTEELYDIQADPWDRSDLSADPNNADLLVQLRERAFDAWYSNADGVNPCPADFDYSGEVNLDDLTAVLVRFGIPEYSKYDLNQSGLIDLDDLTLLLRAFGSTCVH